MWLKRTDDLADPWVSLKPPDKVVLVSLTSFHPTWSTDGRDWFRTPTIPVLPSTRPPPEVERLVRQFACPLQVLQFTRTLSEWSSSLFSLNCELSSSLESPTLNPPESGLSELRVFLAAWLIHINLPFYAVLLGSPLSDELVTLSHPLPPP
ncbi:hypothetical protein EI94DRAFT_1800980 [Lactarius quietus]|nr:hypothetical protein EI94DRAFT_1800980 [Lactarius quietus]